MSESSNEKKVLPERIILVPGTHGPQEARELPTFVAGGVRYLACGPVSETGESLNSTALERDFYRERYEHLMKENTRLFFEVQEAREVAYQLQWHGSLERLPDWLRHE